VACRQRSSTSVSFQDSMASMHHERRSMNDPEPIRPEPNRWDSVFSWTGLLLVGLLVYEATSQATLGVSVLCCKIGWEDFSTAIWLRRKDPVPARGKMEFWIFVAAGLLKTAGLAFMLMVVYSFFLVEQAQGDRNDRDSNELIQAAATGMIGFLLSSLATVRALGLAIWHKQKIWQSASVHSARRHDEWPPTVSGGGNKADTIILCSFFLVSILAIISLIVTLAFQFEREINAAAGVFTTFLTGLLIGFPMLVLWGRDYMERNVLAVNPGECWRLTQERRA
jgi:hypothetical protein